MKIDHLDRPRKFKVGAGQKITITDCGKILLDTNEQVSLSTDSDACWEIVRKEWGFYATPSIGHRLKRQGFRTALMANQDGRVYLVIVEETQRERFDEYCNRESQKVLRWLDEPFSFCDDSA